MIVSQLPKESLGSKLTYDSAHILMETKLPGSFCFFCKILVLNIFLCRFQALNLLRKYYKSNLIERVKPSKNDKEIQDNNELYRFTIDANENLPCLPTSKSESDLLESCAMVDPEKPVELDLREKVDIYKRTMWAHMNKLLLNISDYIKAENIDGSSLFYNVTRVNTNGVVQVIDKNQDLPHWVMSAMKCLANCKFFAH